MRRIAAVFASKRSDRSDAASSAASATTDHSQQTTKPFASKRFFRSISRKNRPVDPVLDRLNSSDLHPLSSSSSSSGAPTTPDDDRGSLLKVPASKVWSPLPHPVDSRLGAFHHLDSTPNDRSRFSTASRPTTSTSLLDVEDETSEESSLTPDLSGLPKLSTPLSAPAYLLALTTCNLRPPYAPPPLLHVPNSPVFPRSCNAQRTLPYLDSLESTMHRTRLQRRLQHGDLSPEDARSITSFAGRRTALRDRPSLQLDDTAVRSELIQSHSSGLRKWAVRPCFEDRMLVLLAENVPAGANFLHTASNAGLHVNGEPRWTRVEPATSCGIADLEYSLTLEVLAGLYEEDLPREQERRGPAPDTSALGYLRLDTQLSLDLGPPLTQSPTAVSPSVSSSSSSSSQGPLSPATMSVPAPTTSTSSSPRSAQPPALVPSQSRGQFYKPNPSPLRVEAVSASSPTLSSTTELSATPAESAAVPTPAKSAVSPSSASSAPAAPLRPALKQGVRFAEEEKDDQVPLGYVMRIKQKREEKARFLQVERERRKHEEERRKHEEEKRKWEEERAKWEREKRAMEEERKKRLYADEVAAARSRRESQRFPLGVPNSSGEGIATGQWDRGERGRAQRDSSPSYTRAAYDLSSHAIMPPRQNSDASLAVPKASRRGSASGSGSGSPGESRPNSVYGSASGGSRPASIHSGVPTPSSSQQDVRPPRERRISNTGSRRGSMISDSGSSWRRSEVGHVPPLPPVWAVPVNMNMMPMPMSAMGMGMPMQGMQLQMPMYGMNMDMPLLPPSPPFMMQQYRQRSSSRSSQHLPPSPQRSHSSSPTLGQHNLPSTGSSERVNRMSHPRGRDSSSASAHTPSVPRSDSSQRRPQHHRSSSGASSELPHRSSGAPRNHDGNDRQRSKLAPPARPASLNPQSQRPRPTHSASLPPQPPAVSSQPRQSWAIPQPGFQNLSRPAGGRRQTVIS